MRAYAVCAGLSAEAPSPIGSIPSSQINKATGYTRELKRVVQQEQIAQHPREQPQLPVNSSPQPPQHRAMLQPRQHAHLAPFVPQQRQQVRWLG